MASNRGLLEDVQQTVRSNTQSSLTSRVRVKKDDLIETVTRHRDEHVAIFKEAITAWARVLRDGLVAANNAAGDGSDSVRVVVNNPRPYNHTKDYDRIIRMLDLSVDDVIDLNETEFACIMMDDWSWQRDFLLIASRYSAKAGDKFDFAYSTAPPTPTPMTTTSGSTSLSSTYANR